MRFRVGPEAGNAGPFLAQTFVIGIAILGDKRVQALGMRQHQAETDRRAVIVNVEAVAVDLQADEQIVHHLREMVECIGK